MIQHWYRTKPLKNAKDEYLKPYVYNGITYYKHGEMIDLHIYEIYGNDIVIFGREDTDYIVTVFNFNLDGELVEKPDYANGSSAEAGYIYKLGFEFD